MVVNIIMAIVRSSLIKEAITKTKNQILAPIIFTDTLKEYVGISKSKHVGLLLLEYEVVRYFSDEERSFFYRMECPRLVITKVGKEYFIFPIPLYKWLGLSGGLQLNELVKLVNEYYRPQHEHSLFSGEEHQFITRNPALLEIYKSAQRVAQFDTPVLILGENGTGKEVVAHLIHKFSKRSQRPIVKINCAAIPPHLMESELFGYRKGAFTNAFQDKIGKIQLANGGTVFLDEIGELDLTLQGKLLRVIEYGEIDVVGGSEPVKVDVRFISATNKDLHLALAEKKFREDLFYRLNVITYKLPPLRERPEDIPILCDYFLSVFTRKYNKIIQKIKIEVLQELFNYDWPGNIRELRHFMERLVLKCEGDTIDSPLVNSEMEELRVMSPETKRNQNLKLFLEHQEKQHIIRSLVQNDFRVGKTAARLGISRVSLFRRMKKYDIDLVPLKSNNRADKEINSD
ncbi:MAG: hypothetical protein Kow0042_29460 [Calditrichia bacterium]